MGLRRLRRGDDRPPDGGGCVAGGGGHGGISVVVSVTARVAAHGFAAQIETLGRADAAGDRADRHVGSVWRRLLSILDQFRGPHRAVDAYQAIIELLRPLGHELVGVIGKAATDAARESYDDAAGTLIAQLPAPMLLRAVPVTEAREPLQITFDGVRGFLPNFDRLPDDEQDELFRQMIFPAPSAERVRSVVYGNGWITRIDAMTRAAPPESVASAVMQNITAGKKINDLARELLPMFNGVRATARRVARDTSMHAAHAMQHQAWNQLGDLVLGYQVNAVLDERTRPEHRARNGQRFYKNPKPGQKGMDECPQPPFESPRNGAGLAFNCRCLLPGNRVAGLIQSVSKAVYDGECVEVLTAGGVRFTVTGNHPVATDSGIVAASLLCKGDNLLSDLSRVGDFAHDVHNMPPTVEDVFEAIRIRGGLSILDNANPLDFHKDAGRFVGQIDVVSTYGELMGGREPGRPQRFGKRQFTRRGRGLVRVGHLPDSLGVAHAGPLQPFRCLASANRYAGLDQHSRYAKGLIATAAAVRAATGQTVTVSKRFERFAGEVSGNEVGRRFLAADHNAGLDRIADRDTGVNQAAAHRIGFDPEIGSDAGHRLAGKVSLAKFVAVGDGLTHCQSQRFGPVANADAVMPENCLDSVSAATEFFGNLAERYPGFVKTDRIIAVRKFHYFGPVYSVGSKTGYYQASLTGNAMSYHKNCFLTPTLANPTDAGTELLPGAILDRETAANWYGNTSKRNQRIAIGAERYDVATTTLGRPPTWHDVTDATGQLLPVDMLRRSMAA